MGDGENDEEEIEAIEEIETITEEIALYHVITPEGCVPLEQFGGDRRCKKCGAKLSIYNPDPECWPCQEKMEKRIDRMIAEAELRDEAAGRKIKDRRQ